MTRRGKNGFTIVELLIVIVIMGILLVLGVANLRGAQANSRDSQRASDVQTIATSLEAFYPLGNSTVTAGEYPSTNLVSNPTTYLTDINPNSLIAPNQTTPALTAATSNGAQTPTINQYIYQPLASDGSLCTSDAQGCRKFNLYYQTEVDSVVHQITSRHQ